MLNKNKSVWIPRIPRTASTYLITKLRYAAVEQSWKLLDKMHLSTTLQSELTDYNCIYTGHNSYYSNKIKDWTKLLLVRHDVIGRFVSSYNFSNHLLYTHQKELMNLDEFIDFHLDTDSEHSRNLIQKNKGCWNPFTDTVAYLNFIQETHEQPEIENIVDFFDEIYFTETVDHLLEDLEHVYGYNLNYSSDSINSDDWDIEMVRRKHSSLDFKNTNPVQVHELTKDQLDRIMNINSIQKEYQFLEILLSKKRSNDH